MTEDSEECRVTVPNHSVQNNEIEEETPPLLEYGQARWMRCTFVCSLLVLFAVGFLAGVYLLLTTEYHRDLYQTINEDDGKITVQTHQDVAERPSGFIRNKWKAFALFFKNYFLYYQK